MISVQRFQDEASWLAARVESIGASETPCLLGCAPPRMDAEKMRAELIASKATGVRKKRDAKSRARMDAGKIFEARGLVLLGEKLKTPVAPCGFTIYRNPLFPFLHATPDAVVGDALAECKALGPDSILEWGDYSGWQGRWKWNDEPPVRHQVQAQAQMAAAGAFRSWVCCVAGTDFNAWQVERDDELLLMIRSAVLAAVDEINAARESQKEAAQ